MWHIRADQEHHGEREETCQKRKENLSEKIRSESQKSSVEQSRSSSVVQNDAEQGEEQKREGRKTTAAKYTERWKIIR